MIIGKKGEKMSKIIFRDKLKILTLARRVRFPRMSQRDLVQKLHKHFNDLVSKYELGIASNITAVSYEENDIWMAKDITLWQPLFDQYIRWHFIRFILKLPNDSLLKFTEDIQECVYFLLW